MEEHMSYPERDAVPPQQLLTMRIVNLAMIGGVVFFLVIVLFLRAKGDQAPAPSFPYLTYLGLVFALVTLAAHFLVPRMVVTANRRRFASIAALEGTPVEALPVDDLRWLNLYQTRLIISAAILEAACFFLLIAYLLEGELTCLVAAGVLLTLLAVKFPTRDGISRWIAEQRELMYQDRLRS
jgi:hypothetical protein